MNIALVYDRVNKIGGAERILSALHELWPQAPLFTAVYDLKGAPWAQTFDVRTSFLQKIPFASTNHELFPWLTPLAFESFQFDSYDVVISITSAEAKYVLTKPETLHICYCLTPTRYLWSGFHEYMRYPGFGPVNFLSRSLFKLLAPALRRWDVIASNRPDHYIAISDHVKQRIEQYYKTCVDKVIYPPVDIGTFHPKDASHKQKDYFLVVSRMVGYKRLDLIVRAFSRTGKPLIIIGHGREKKSLQQQAGKNILFIEKNLTDNELVRYYQNCRALIFTGDEDFGLTAVEAQACGRPVIAFRSSGITEIVQNDKTGILFEHQTSQCLQEAIEQFQHRIFSPYECRKNAERFCKKKFLNDFSKYMYTKVKQKQL